LPFRHQVAEWLEKSLNLLLHINAANKRFIANDLWQGVDFYVADLRNAENMQPIKMQEAA
jgi:hypothetical protein